MNLDKDKNIKNLLRQGFLHAIFYGLTNPFIIPFAVALGVTNTAVGMLTAAPFLAAMLAQLPGAELVTLFKKRKMIASINFFIGRSMWFVISLLPLFIVETNKLFWTVFAFYVMWAFAGNLGGPAWISLESSHVPKKQRGNFYGRLTKWIALGITITTLFGGFYLDLFPEGSLKGFSNLFGLGAIFGLIGIFFMLKVKDKKFKPLPVLKNLFNAKKEFKLFTLFNTYFNFSLMFAMPFFIVYILNDLGASYSMLVVALSSGALMQIMTQKYWGSLADTYGDKPIMILACMGNALVPLIYLFIRPEMAWLIIPAEMFAGAAWGAYAITRINLLLDFTEPRKRPIRTAEYVMITSVPMIFAPIIGGWVADNLSFILTGIPLVFAIAFVLRALTPLFLIKMKEPRIKHEYSLKQVVREAINGFHPVRDTGTRVVVGIKNINHLFHGNKK